MRLSPQAAELLEQAQPLWTEAGKSPFPRLLRLAVLRDLVRSLHAERSRLMALRQPGRAGALKEVEPVLESLRRESLDDASLVNLARSRSLAGAEKLEPTPVPEAVTAAFGAGRLDRYDRLWEAEIATEAHARGWKFWNLDAWVDLARAEQFHLVLGQRLWPDGLVLFVESAQSETRGADAALRWLGRWLVAARAEWAPATAPLQNLPGGDAAGGRWTARNP